MRMIRVIVAEDISLLREDIVETINAAPDMNVVGHVGTGAEAVELASCVSFDIALLDIEMESAMAGVRAAERILGFHPESKVIYLTIHETEEIIIEAMGSGASDYLVKGGDKEEMLDHIRCVYNGKPMLEERIHAIVMKEYYRLRKSEASLLYFITNISKLTMTERELLKYLLQGCNVAEIARLRVVEVVTVKTQIKSLLHKFGCRRTKEIVEVINQMGIAYLFLKE